LPHHFANRHRTKRQRHRFAVAQRQHRATAWPRLKKPSRSQTVAQRQKARRLACGIGWQKTKGTIFQSPRYVMLDWLSERIASRSNVKAGQILWPEKHRPNNQPAAATRLLRKP
jgi:hypothetical protein